MPETAGFLLYNHYYIYVNACGDLLNLKFSITRYPCRGNITGLKQRLCDTLNQNKIKMFDTSMPVEHINYYGAHLKHESLFALPIAEIARQICIKHFAG